MLFAGPTRQSLGQSLCHFGPGGTRAWVGYPNSEDAPDPTPNVGCSGALRILCGLQVWLIKRGYTALRLLGFVRRSVCFAEDTQDINKRSGLYSLSAMASELVLPKHVVEDRRGRGGGGGGGGFSRRSTNSSFCTFHFAPPKNLGPGGGPCYGLIVSVLLHSWIQPAHRIKRTWSLADKRPAACLAGCPVGQSASRPVRRAACPPTPVRLPASLCSLERHAHAHG